MLWGVGGAAVGIVGGCRCGDCWGLMADLTAQSPWAANIELANPTTIGFDLAEPLNRKSPFVLPFREQKRDIQRTAKPFRSARRGLSPVSHRASDAHWLLS